jgi:hypothetical protein
VVVREIDDGKSISALRQHSAGHHHVGPGEIALL